MIEDKKILEALALQLYKVAESYYDNKVDYYKPRYIDLQIKFTVDPATNEIVHSISCGSKIPPRYIVTPTHQTRDELMDEVLEDQEKYVPIRNS